MEASRVVVAQDRNAAIRAPDRARKSGGSAKALRDLVWQLHILAAQKKCAAEHHVEREKVVWERLLVSPTVSVKLAENLGLKEPLASPGPSGRTGRPGQEPADVEKTSGVGE
jgi:hypothetical protein